MPQDVSPQNVSGDGLCVAIGREF